MSHSKSYEFLLKDISTLKRVGQKTKKLLKKKKIENLFDVLWHLPHAFVDRSNLININKLEVGKICTIRVQVKKYNIPRIRNLPNTVKCEDSTGKIDIVFFNSREGYIKKILPLNEWVIISGKVNFYNKKYQITNPAYVVPLEKEDFVKRIIPRYSLTEGITEKVYRNIIEQVLKKLPFFPEWHNENIMKKFDYKNWRESILHLHDPKIKQDFQSNYYRRLVYDEILSSLIVLSQIRKKIKKIKKEPKKFGNKLSKKIISNFHFQLTKNQIDIINEINRDLFSQSKMFRLLQGDVGSGKTIVALIAAANVIESGYQVAFMAPTEILANQHYRLANKIFNESNIKTDFLTGKTSNSERKIKINALKENNVEYKVGQFPFRALGRARASGDIDGFVKILADKKTDEVLGVHMIGARCADLIAEAVVAMEYRASAEDISRMSHAHPTFAEAVKAEPSRIFGSYEKILSKKDFFCPEYHYHSYLERGKYFDQLMYYL